MCFSDSTRDDKQKREELSIHRCRFGGVVISAAGYDAQCALLEVEFAQNGQVWQYMDVPEETWYRFKNEEGPDMFFHRHIKGCYSEKRVLPT